MQQSTENLLSQNFNNNYYSNNNNLTTANSVTNAAISLYSESFTHNSLLYYESIDVINDHYKESTLDNNMDSFLWALDVLVFAVNLIIPIILANRVRNNTKYYFFSAF